MKTKIILYLMLFVILGISACSKDHNGPRPHGPCNHHHHPPADSTGTGTGTDTTNTGRG